MPEPITAAYIARAILSQPWSEAREAKAQATAKRFNIAWVAVESAMREVLRDAQSRLEA